ncbi:hypothetical protein [Nannocystis bainbridge]|uniref:T6SS immunity protein Tdi1 C-terminal domain-containing protein n=1 Tax=Nannocystis bainbridge TaxID=2995303 RepID=A0ABT5DR74_9BACT|nr:hypothetical protein [Nannocystis bainbridge]MDC0716130.1 hypothetical protein [Nannocystis bainbridge]
MRNGFLAFDRALRVFSAVAQVHPLSLTGWNGSTLWRDAYGPLVDDLVFFADDIFGGQFCIREDRIFLLDPETAVLELMAESLDGWAERVLEDTSYLTGQRLAHEWRTSFGPIELTQRLLPKLPFVTGGRFELENLYACDAVEGMRFRGELARQIQALPDGTPIRFVFRDEPE